MSDTSSDVSEQDTMSNPESLVLWSDDVDPEEIDAILEWLSDMGLLTERGEAFATEFWERYLHTGIDGGEV